VSYLTKEFIKNNPNKIVYIIGKNTKGVKLKVYQKMYDIIFSDEFIKTEGWNVGYDEGCFYFIKNKKK